ncbi:MULTISPECIES: aminodeoxychorismate/anthranilate synthase component II [Gammaproteobacteria]|uniref:anthranilate synthase component II n=1 Tax=Gammaproteobacteria TaxID=1236 RepID=UPI000DD09427|nr:MULTISPECIES: aminodeoxychorismate/anthranilate synthase component II [Gammaproteobacteria]RTE85716.1 aminodeoxychorismate/anthranilate synthase component II [Aliidiomarina sp. B3213]TCZ90282.1 aminodeoxychorismate/anthranilate synthase component II [Lysobacter sp. N42]
MILIIDNYDSFTHNLARYFAELGQAVKVVRNDAISIQELQKLSIDALVISPGPCTPDESGVSLQAIEYFADKVPILGVCLGHQAIGQVFGGKVTRAERVMHGKRSTVEHNGSGLFAGVKNPLEVVRYHSLVIDTKSLPTVLTPTAWVTEGNGQEQRQVIMAVEHKDLPIWGVQFHPESVLSHGGHSLLENFCKLANLPITQLPREVLPELVG